MTWAPDSVLQHERPKLFNIAQSSRSEGHILNSVERSELYLRVVPKDLNMSEYPEKNMARRSRRSRDGAFAKRHGVAPEADTQAAKGAEGLLENRANGNYSEAGIGILPISILT